jgi:hypothetical protein
MWDSTYGKYNDTNVWRYKKITDLLYISEKMKDLYPVTQHPTVYVIAR